MTGETSGLPPNPFNAERLKSLPLAELSHELIGDAYATILKFDEVDREALEEQLYDICWLPNEAEQAVLDARAEALKQVLSEQDVAKANFMSGEDMDPEEARRYLSRYIVSRAMVKIDLLKTTIDDDIERGTAPEPSIYYRLLELCAAQGEAGISYVADYVREMAATALNHKGRRGVLLLKNAVLGDEASYEPGLAAVTEGLQATESTERLGFNDGADALECLMFFMEKAGPEEQDRLRNLAIDMIVYIRNWMNEVDIPSYTRIYAVLAAEFGVEMRNQASGRQP